MLLRHHPAALANHGRPPSSPSNASKIFLSPPITFSPTVRYSKSFKCNTYKFPRKCCKQTTYSKINSFKCNTYKKQGGGARALRRSKVNRPLSTVHHFASLLRYLSTSLLRYFNTPLAPYPRFIPFPTVNCRLSTSPSIYHPRATPHLLVESSQQHHPGATHV
jgi:hypothetical protein